MKPMLDGLFRRVRYYERVAKQCYVLSPGQSLPAWSVCPGRSFNPSGRSVRASPEGTLR